MPPPPKSTSTEPAGSSWLAFFVTLLVVICGCAVGFLIFPQLFLALGIISALFALQYLVWGWWMERMFRPPGEDVGPKPPEE